MIDSMVAICICDCTCICCCDTGFLPAQMCLRGVVLPTG
ncbi:Uncharacterised protein [Aedoeadaptatus ivorii]|uniref:Uncharacterized protein n=1 Tax=Aedoeadaptatus ivorii TaxID=54006 RepID=A0A448V380_9FIRM|nr:hypothetical protein [Peptoniphilus ivorii]VEJ36266.1 Uncharacterised protein [Peptoniphilus ivorii]